MFSHARHGDDIEVMGLLQGKVEDRTMLVMDVFALPVEGTETRVNAHHEANEYMVQYLDNSKQANRPENAIGWYHSHPGYGCWLSGIDVSTQKLNQAYQEPWLAIVVDHKRTSSLGTVDIGAFRTYPESPLDEIMLKSISQDSYQNFFEGIDSFEEHSHVSQKIFELVKNFSANVSEFSSLQLLDSNDHSNRTKHITDNL
ncbi:hypothetical protein BB561_005768 [Smittium simulii]|uniref:COP9 signalosome complex subunit 5 n=1 Tax=Smittium simulii TaxID=133385 RepID=A0A2T9Y8F5_9FUNG|nr:hypothetical protein BB561_005768 [Smittium simulii]